jgi:hypothetical protein
VGGGCGVHWSRRKGAWFRFDRPYSAAYGGSRCVGRRREGGQRLGRAGLSATESACALPRVDDVVISIQVLHQSTPARARGTESIFPPHRQHQHRRQRPQTPKSDTDADTQPTRTYTHTLSRTNTHTYSHTFSRTRTRVLKHTHTHAHRHRHRPPTTDNVRSVLVGGVTVLSILSRSVTPVPRHPSSRAVGQEFGWERTKRQVT